MSPRVLHVRRAAVEDGVYIGRPSKFGNPFVIGQHGTRDEVIDRYARWIETQPTLLAAARRELQGQSLICHCAPRRCHGDVLLRIANPELESLTMSHPQTQLLREMIRSAVISPCGQFRYTLTRSWDAKRPRLLFVMLNPSTADGLVDDRTVAKCVAFATRLGFGSIEIVNLWAFRTKNPMVLRTAGYPVGPENDAHIAEACFRANEVICAWGQNARQRGVYLPRVAEVLALIDTWAANPPMALRLSDDGTPWHPLYLAGDSVPVPLPR